MAILDTYSNVTGAWSMDRVIVGAYGGTKYDTVTGVSSWNDQSGNARHMVQATTANQPLVTTAGSQARTCMLFDGVNDVLAGAALSNFVTNTTGYIACVFLPRVATLNDQAALYKNDAPFADAGGYIGVHFTTTGQVYALNDDAASDIASYYNIAIGGPVLVAEWKHESGNVLFRLNGGSWVSTATGNTMSMTNAFQFGKPVTVATYSDLYLFEVVTFNVIPSGAQQNTLAADMLAHYRSSGILDTYTGVTAAWSMDRHLVGTYINTLYTTATGVNAINDQSGAGRNLVQSNTSYQPAVSTAGAQSRACAVLDGSDDWMSTAVAVSNLVTNSAGYFTLVFIPQDAANNRTDSVSDGLVNNDYMGLYIANAPNTVYSYHYSDTNVGKSALFPNIPFSANGPVLFVEWKNESGNILIRVNGESWVSTATATATLNAAALSQLLYIGAHPTYGLRSRMKLFELITFNVVPSVAQQNALIADQIARFSGTSQYADKLYMTAAYANANANNTVDAISANKMFMTAAYANANAINYVDAISLNKAYLTAAYKFGPFYIAGASLRAGIVMGYDYGPYPLTITTMDDTGATFTQEDLIIYILQAGAPALHSQQALPTTSTTADLSVTTTGNTGTIYWVVTSTKDVPSKTQIIAGQSATGAAAAASGTIAVSSSGVKTATASGLVAGLGYWAHWYQVAADAKQSNIVSVVRGVPAEAPAPPLLDAYGASISAAWSLSRDLVTGSAGRYVDTAGEITTLYDQFGDTGRNFTDGSVAARRPALTTGGPNNIACADFDGLTDFLTTTDIGTDFINTTSSFMAVTVIVDAYTRNDGTWPQNNDSILQNTPGGFAITARNISGGIVYAFNWDGNADAASVTLIPGTLAVIHWRHHANQLFVGKNGVESAPVASGTTAAGAEIGTMNLGSRGADYYANFKFFEGFTAKDGSHAYPDAIADMLVRHVSASVGILDGISGLTGAWSASRILRSAYVGSKYNLVGGVVGALYDQSGLNTDNHFVHNTATNRPSITNEGPNSVPAINFDGTDNFLQTTSMISAFYTTTDGYAVVSFLPDNVSYNQPNFMDCGTVLCDLNAYHGIFIKNGQIGVMHNDGSFDFTTPTDAVVVGTPYVVEFWHTGGVAYCRLNGGTTRSIASGTTSGSTGQMRLGLNRVINQFYTDIKVFEVVTFNAVPSLATRDALVADMIAHVGATPIVPPPPGPLNGVSIASTGAWSASRELYGGFGTNFYTDVGGGSISVLEDHSGNNRDFGQGTSSKRPTVMTAGPNNRMAINFDGSDDSLTGAILSNYISASAGYIIVSVMFDTITLNNAQAYQDHAVIADAGGYMGIIASNTAGTPETIRAYNYDTTQDYANEVGIVINTPYVFEWRHESGNVYVRVNGGSWSAPTASGNTGALTFNLSIGSGYAGSAYFDGKIFEIAAYATVPSVAEQDALCTNFKTWVGA